MKPMRPLPPSRANMRAGPRWPSLASPSGTRRTCCSTAARMSLAGQKFSGLHRVSLPMGMNSMKRTSTGRVMAAWTKSASWPSLMPRRPTALILTRMPAASMASRARSTSGSMSRPVTRAKVSRSKLSSDRFTALMRMRCSRGMCSSSRVPLVVMRMSRSSKRCRKRRRKSSQPLRAKGSPPVRRTLPTPMPRTIRTRRSISS